MATTASAIADTGWLAWRDPRAWMETMRGPRWTALVRRENEAFDAAVRKAAAGKEEVEAAVSQFEAAAEEEDVARSWHVEVPGAKQEIRVLPHGSAGLTWFWEERTEGKGAKGTMAGDLAVGEGVVAYTHDFGKGEESYELVVLGADTHKLLWRSRGKGGKGYGPSVAIVDGWVLALEADSPLRYSRLVAIELKRGQGRRVLAEESPHSGCTLSMIKGEYGCLFLVAENAGHQRLSWLETKTMQFHRICPEGVSFHPIGFVEGGRTTPSYFVRKGDCKAPWELEGPLCGRWKGWGDFVNHGIEEVVASLGVVVWKRHGQRIFWRAGERGEPVQLLAECSVNPWARWAGAPMEEECVVTVPGATPVRATIGQGKIRLANPVSEYGGRRRIGWATSADATRVRWVCVENANRGAARLLVAAYGAYGLTTTLDMSRWKPYLERGWAVALAFVRGGGDDNEAWAEAGRREGKLRGVEDLEACIRVVQQRTNLGPAETVVFGRSAGGYLVGTAIVRQPRGELFTSAYVEVPYVDVLRTASNPALPLTEYEYFEFGDPAHKIADFAFLLRHAPVSGLGPEGAPGVQVLCRTSLNDRQVYAYESAKWVDALRGSGATATAAPKWLAFQAGEGHFLQGEARAIQRAEDFLLLTK